MLLFKRQQERGPAWVEAILAEHNPGTKMILVGIKNEREIADLTAFLKQFGKDGKKM